MRIPYHFLRTRGKFWHRIRKPRRDWSRTHTQANQSIRQRPHHRLEYKRIHLSKIIQEPSLIEKIF